MSISEAAGWLVIPIGAALSAGVPCAVLRLGGLDMVRIVEKMHMCIVILPSSQLTGITIHASAG